MYQDLVEAKYLKNYALWLPFAGGTKGEFDFHEELSGEVFGPLKGISKFIEFFTHPELKVLTWPKGADVSPEFLYRLLRQAA